MKYTAALISVRSMAVSRPFYEEFLGQKVTADINNVNVSFEGGFTLQADFAGLVGFPSERTVWKAHDMELYFETDDFDAAADKIKSRSSVELVHDVKEYPWGQRVLRFYDPDGHMIELGESMEMVVLRCLSQGMTEEETSVRTMFPVEFVRLCKSQASGG